MELVLSNSPDTVFAFMVGPLTAYVLFRAFLDRGYEYLALFSVPVFSIAIVQTALRAVTRNLADGSFSSTVVEPILEQMRVGYKLVLVPILIMLTVSYLVKLHQSARQEEADTYAQLRKVHEMGAHRTKNQLETIHSRLRVFKSQQRYANSTEAKSVLDKMDLIVQGALALNKAIEANFKFSGAKNTDIDLRVMLESLVPRIWCESLGNDRKDLVFINMVPAGKHINSQLGGTIQEVINELLSNIDGHAYPVGQRSLPLEASISLTDEALIVGLKDEGSGFDGGVDNPPLGSGLDFIQRTVANLNGTVTFSVLQPTEVSPGGTVCQLTIPI